MLPFRSLGVVLASIFLIVACAFGVMVGKQSDHVFAYAALAVVAYVFLTICCCCVLPVWNSELDCNKVFLLFRRRSSDNGNSPEKPTDTIDDFKGPTKKFRSCGLCLELPEEREMTADPCQQIITPMDVKRNRASSLKSSALSTISEATSLSFASEANLPIPDTIFLTHPNGSFTRYVKVDPNLLSNHASYV